MSVLKKASQLIECLGQAREPVTLGYVRTEVGMPKSSAHRLLNELAESGFVRRGDDGLYSLGPRLMYWGQVAAETLDLQKIAQHPMRRLRNEVAESVHLYIRKDDSRVCIAAAEAEHILRPFIELGRPLPLRVGAAGRLLLAFAEPEIQKLELSRARSDAKKIRNAPGEKLSEQLGRVRVQRWATSMGEREEGVSAAATAVVDPGDHVIAALSISAPSTRLHQTRMGELRQPLENCAEEIHAALFETREGR